MRLVRALGLALVSLALSACEGGAALTPPAQVAPDALEPPAPPAPVTGTAPLPAVTVEAPPAPALPSAPTQGNAIAFAPADLEGVFLYGLGSDPDGIIGMLGGGAAGITPMKVRLVLEGGALAIRTLDPRSGKAGAGPEHLVESYPYTLAEDGAVLVDFTAPASAPGFALWDTCRYDLADYTLAAAPRFADGLVTWPADERYTKSGCPPWAPASARGVNVHFLRHAAAAAAFTPRRADPTSPFGFFEVPVADAPDAAWLSRLANIRPGAPDGSVVYHLSANFPEAYVPAATSIFEAWNDALEAAVGMRPFAVARAPEDMIPWDPRYHVVLWRETGSGGAVAPFAQDPDTGEIVQSFVVMWFGDIADLVARYQDFFDAHPDFAASVLAGVPLPPAPEVAPRLPLHPQLTAALAPPRYLRARAFSSRTLQPAEVARARAALGRQATDEQVAAFIVADFLVHEVGHNLGLRHNFVGSADHAHADPGASSTTTMDYVIGLAHPGPYDRDAMRYAYGAGARDTTYLYCTDEDVDVDGACVQWDFGHPLRYDLDAFDALAAEYPLETPAAEVSGAAEDEGWAALFLRARKLVNTPWELSDPAAPLDGFAELLDRVVCAEPCATHAWLRGQLALQLLYARHAVEAWWEEGYPTIWIDLPPLDETEQVELLASFFDLVTAPAEPRSLKTTIVQKLATTTLAGAPTLLADLRAHFVALAAPTEDDAAVLAAIEAALPD